MNNKQINKKGNLDSGKFYKEYLKSNITMFWELLCITVVGTELF